MWIARLAAYCGIAGGFDGYLAEVLALREAVGVPHALPGLGIDRERVGLIVEVPSLEAWQEALQSEGAAEAMKYDGVRPETILGLVEA